MLFHLKIIEAQDVPRMDILSDSDPYCTITHHPPNRTVKTKIIPDCANPVWNESFIFRVIDTDSDYFVIQMFDEDVLTDSIICDLRLAVADLCEGIIEEGWFQMNPLNTIRQKARIHLRFQLAVTGRAPFVPY
jgi:Ca2+-dependent lipid-binding protein